MASCQSPHPHRRRFYGAGIFFVIHLHILARFIIVPQPIAGTCHPKRSTRGQGKKQERPIV